MKKVIILFAYMLTCHFAVPEARGDDAIIEKIIAWQNRIRTIDCSLSQLIFEGGSALRYEGRFRADSKGRFRIDYTIPSRQTVLNTTGGLFWHMPESNTLYIIPARDPSLPVSPAGSVAGIIKKIEKNMDVRYLGAHLHGFFTVAHRFIMLDRKHGSKMEIIAGARDNTILQKRLLDRDGYEVMRELYSGYSPIDGIQFPMRIDVYARTANGVTRSISRYGNVTLNGAIQESVFRLNVPVNVKKMTYGTR